MTHLDSFKEAALRRDRNSSMRSVAKRFLGWFETDMPRGAEAIYAPGTDYVERYRTDEGGMKNAMDFVGKLAGERLSYREACIVIEEAGKLLRPNG